MKIFIALLTALLLTQQAQDPNQRDQVMKAVRAAIAPVIASFPQSDEDGSLPVGGNTDAVWMVRPDRPFENTIEIHANPLNEQNQRVAARAMAVIERNIEAAQRRAAAQYDRAVEEARRTGKSQDVDGVTLSDEGIEGAKIDAESQVFIDAAFNHEAYRYLIKSGAPPVVSTELAGAITIVSFPANTYRDSNLNADRYFAAEAVVFLGRIVQPKVSKTGDNSYEVFATATPADRPGINTVVVNLKGNEALVKELLKKTTWGQLVELMK
jgi:hypothetical protein